MNAERAEPVMSFEEAQRSFPPLWTIYFNPSDYPGLYVVRLWYGLVPDPGEPATFHFLRGARKYALRSGASMRLERAPLDDSCIMECWV